MYIVYVESKYIWICGLFTTSNSSISFRTVIELNPKIKTTVLLRHNVIISDGNRTIIKSFIMNRNCHVLSEKKLCLSLLNEMIRDPASKQHRGNSNKPRDTKHPIMSSNKLGNALMTSNNQKRSLAKEAEPISIKAPIKGLI